MATKTKTPKKPFGSISADGPRPLTKAEKKWMTKNKIGLLFKIDKGDKFAFKIGRKTVKIID